MMFVLPDFCEEAVTIDGRTVHFRAYRSVAYAQKPISPEHQCMNIFVPEEYFDDRRVGRYTAKTAPVFFANSIGGYMASLPGEPDFLRREKTCTTQPNTLFQALVHGYVVVSPGTRGRDLYNQDDCNLGRAPAGIVDLKAAVRCLRSLRKQLPGNMDLIVSDGTSAGGAMSALLGSTCDRPEYLPYLEEIGAAVEESDRIFAAVCYCPVTNLEHIDQAFEWAFHGFYHYVVPQYFGQNFRELPLLPMNEEQRRCSDELAAQFPDYVNSLRLPVTLNEDGSGSFRELLLDELRKSAQGAADRGCDLSEITWLHTENGLVTVHGLEEYASYNRRMKPPVAYDNLDLRSPETDLFAAKRGEGMHFSAYGMKHSHVPAQMVSQSILDMMDPFCHLTNPQKAVNWRIRYGAADVGASVAIPLLLAEALKQQGMNVDFAIAWGWGHAGDYDIPELFAWIDHICE